MRAACAALVLAACVVVLAKAEVVDILDLEASEVDSQHQDGDQSARDDDDVKAVDDAAELGEGEKTAVVGGKRAAFLSTAGSFTLSSGSGSVRNVNNVGAGGFELGESTCQADVDANCASWAQWCEDASWQMWMSSNCATTCCPKPEAPPCFALPDQDGHYNDACLDANKRPKGTWESVKTQAGTTYGFCKGKKMFDVTDLDACKAKARELGWRYVTFSSTLKTRQIAQYRKGGKHAPSNCVVSPSCFDPTTSLNVRGWEIHKWSIDPAFSDCDSPGWAPFHNTVALVNFGDLRQCKEPALDEAGKPISVTFGVPICKSCYTSCGHYLEKVHHSGGRCWGGERAFHMYPGGSVRSSMDNCQAHCYRTAASGEDWWDIAASKGRDDAKLHKEGRVTGGVTQSFTCTRHCTPNFVSLMDPPGYDVNYIFAKDETSRVYCDFHKVVECWPKASRSTTPGGETTKEEGIDCSQEKRLSCATICQHSAVAEKGCNHTACLDHPKICETMTTYM